MSVFKDCTKVNAKQFLCQIQDAQKSDCDQFEWFRNADDSSTILQIKNEDSVLCVRQQKKELNESCSSFDWYNYQADNHTDNSALCKITTSLSHTPQVNMAEITTKVENNCTVTGYHADHNKPPLVEENKPFHDMQTAINECQANEECDNVTIYNYCDDSDDKSCETLYYLRRKDDKASCANYFQGYIPKNVNR